MYSYNVFTSIKIFSSFEYYFKLGLKPTEGASRIKYWKELKQISDQIGMV